MGSLNADQDAGHYFGNGAAGYQNNANQPDTSGQLFQALLKQTMGQQGQGNYGIGNAIAQALQTYMQGSGGSNAEWSPSALNSSFSIGGE